MTARFRPLVLPFAGVDPAFGSGPRACGSGSSVLGRVTVGSGLVLGAFAVIRADGEIVRIGDDFNLGEGATVHIAHDVYPTIVGDRVAVGRNAVVHACTVADDVVIEDDVVILDASEVGAGVLIEAGSTVYPRSVLDAGGHYAGSPAKRVGSVDPAERGCRRAAVRAAAEVSASSSAEAPGRWGADGRNAHFVADTAILDGDVDLAPGASVFFGCRLRAATIAIGDNTNIQDNSVVDAPGGVFAIGRDSTIGHNVRMGACRIGARSLVGIGAVLAPDTVVEDDVLVAAGAETMPSQVLESGWLWGSRPAKPLRRLDPDKRAMMADTITTYFGYGHAFRAAQDLLAGTRR